MNTKVTTVLVLLVTALAVAGSAGLNRTRASRCAAEVEVASPVVRPEAPPAAPAAAAVTKREANATTTQLLMPDGTSLPPLNGAVDPPKVRWQRGRPWSPVVGTVRLPDGRDAYQHADGSRTVTFMTFREDLGRSVAVTAVSSPMPDVPTLAEENPRSR